MANTPEVSELDIRHALFAGEMFLEYLPVVALLEGDRCVGCEALIRWYRDGKVIPPLRFIPRIEGTPTSGLLTYWVIDRMGSELGSWMLERPQAHVAVNVPPEVLGRGGLLYACYKANLLDVRRRIVLEITERGEPDRLGLEELRAFASEHILIGMDDVDIEQCNLLMFARSPVDLIKLDRSLVARIDAPDEDALRDDLRRMVALQRQQFVAEGVERQEQADVLRDLGIQFAQGWLYSRPLSAERFKDWEREHADWRRHDLESHTYW